LKIAASIIRWIPLTIIAFALISILALLQLDGVINRDLYAYGLQFSPEWANLYWISIRTALAMLSLILITAIAFQASMILQKTKGKAKDIMENGLLAEKNRNTFKLSDGSTIRIKTVLRRVNRLNTFTPDGKPLYAARADNIVEVVNAPSQLMKPSIQETRAKASKR